MRRRTIWHHHWARASTRGRLLVRHSWVTSVWRKETKLFNIYWIISDLQPFNYEYWLWLWISGSLPQHMSCQMAPPLPKPGSAGSFFLLSFSFPLLPKILVIGGHFIEAAVIVIHINDAIQIKENSSFFIFIRSKIFFHPPLIKILLPLLQPFVATFTWY